MSKKPEMQQTRIPVASPYYDRLRALNIQLMEVPYGSPEYRSLDRQISELEQRARRKVATDARIGVI